MKEEFWTTVCDYMPRLRFLFAALFVLLVLTVFSLAFTTVGSPSYYIALIDLVLVLVATSITVFLQWRCAKNKRRRGEWRPEDRPDE
ncbi:putative membrane protein [Halorhabdus sp. SVX81]|uniref:hypothetical protein n=1 Tax=Halorhabdus sp. SVX81 TaxID=2978283 RepID=UPI0023DBF268|nr:hypothetical protein [Halorhabdus sp. SVX81]WEL17118.1 putative membrane protein [Halorhabdus sp. SVX81]